jgi:hypothetical protein
VTGFISAVIGELLTGRGALGQLQLETRLPQNVINWAVIGIVVGFVTSAPSGACIFALMVMPCCTVSLVDKMMFVRQAFNFITALNPFGPTFDEDNQADVRKRPAGPTQKAMDPSKPAVRMSL